MLDAVSGLQPSSLWQHFAAISAIPRSSKHETEVVRYVTELANRKACQISRDKFGNLVVRKSAHSGYENAPSVCLQGHLDMVCEKNAGNPHDFLKDPIRLRRQGSILTATDTTLGADNGIGVAAILAILESETAVHGPLEILFTLEEEIGLLGAKALEPGLLDSRLLLNLDSEEEGALYIGCSGGRDTIGRWVPLWEEPYEKFIAAKLSIKGLKGGHSGLDIDKQRGNAINVLARLLLPLHGQGVRVGKLSGGSKRNAIPREAEAEIYLPQAKHETLVHSINEHSQVIAAELASADPALRVELETYGSKKAKVLKRVQVRRLLQALDATPHGVMKMSHEIPGLVQTSSNVGVLSTERKLITLGTSQRSASASELNDMAIRVAGLLELGGAKVERLSGYPGWQPDLQSSLLGLAQDIHERVYGWKATIKAIHAGLECGLIREKYPEMDMVSFGPTIENAHSPDECVHIESVQRFYDYLLEILSVIARGAAV